MFVISSTMAELYHLMGQYCAITQEGKRNFTCLGSSNQGLASELIEDPAIRADIESRSFTKFATESLGTKIHEHWEKFMENKRTKQLEPGSILLLIYKFV